MDTLTFRNNPNSYEYLFIFLTVSANFILCISSAPIIFFTSIILTILICLILYARTIEISLTKSSIKIKFKALLFTYKKIALEYDILELSGYLDETLTFYKNNVKILRIQYVDHIEEPSYTAGTIEIKYKQKTIDIGNTKTSYPLFGKIKLLSSKYITTADNPVAK